RDAPRRGRLWAARNLQQNAHDRPRTGLTKPPGGNDAQARYVSLDGVVENPAWTTPFWNDELSELQGEYLYASDALVLGRLTYEGFAASWPAMEESTGDFGKKMNSMPKFVASNTLDEAEWNASIIKG